MIKLKWKKKVNEDDGQQTAETPDSQNTGSSQNENSAKLVQYQQQKAAIIAQMRKDEDALNQKKANYNTQLSAIDKEIATLGGNVTVESLEYKFSKNLYESVGYVGYTESLVSIMRITFEESENISYVPSETSMKTWAKNLINWLNKKISIEYWKTDGQNHLQDFVDKFTELSIDNLQYKGKWSSSEKNTITENFENNIRESSMFKWILGPDEIK